MILKIMMSMIPIKMIIKDGSMSLDSTYSKNEDRIVNPDEVDRREQTRDFSP